jgi:hypothetical protein
MLCRSIAYTKIAMIITDQRGCILYLLFCCSIIIKFLIDILLLPASKCSASPNILSRNSHYCKFRSSSPCSSVIVLTRTMKHQHSRHQDEKSSSEYKTTLVLFRCGNSLPRKNAYTQATDKSNTGCYYFKKQHLFFLFSLMTLCCICFVLSSYR